MKNILFLILISILISCSESNTKWEKNNEVETTLFFLDGSKTTIELPKIFKKSSRYRIKYDLPHLQKDSTALYSIQKLLEMFEFEDSMLDIFVDTLSKASLVFISEFQHTPLNKQLGNLINGNLSQQYRQIDMQNPDIIITKKQSGFRNGKSLKYLKFKFHFDYLNNDDQGDHYYNHYFFTTKVKSYIIFELTPFEEDLEQYFWTIRE